VPSDVADTVMWMLQNVVNAGTGRPASLPDRPAAGKTGTAEGARDLWFIGSIPQLTTAIWFGYDENWRTGSSSATAAAAWYSYMIGLLKEIPVQSFPPRPVLTGSFIPYVPPKQGKPTPSPQTTPAGGWEAPANDNSQRGGWRDRPIDETQWKPPEPEQEKPSWQPPIQPQPWTPPPRSSEPAAAPAPAAPAAPAPTQAPVAAPAAPPPPAAAPLPISPPPPVSAPPPLP